MPISAIHVSDESYYKQPDLFNVRRLMCPDCGFIFDFQYPLDEEPLGFPRLSDEPYYYETRFDGSGNSYEVMEETPNITKHCRRCGLEIKEGTLILINVSPLVKFDDIRKIIEKGESETLELKIGLKDRLNPKSTIKLKMKKKIAKIVASFANKRGGMLIIGVDDETKEIKGIENLTTPRQREDFSRDMRDIIDLIEPAPPNYHLNFIEDEEKTIAIIVINTSKHICRVDNKVPRRDGESSIFLINQESIDNLQESRQQNNQITE